jgi:hypothetical protein
VLFGHLDSAASDALIAHGADVVYVVDRRWQFTDETIQQPGTDPPEKPKSCWQAPPVWAARLSQVAVLLRTGSPPLHNWTSAPAYCTRPAFGVTCSAIVCRTGGHRWRRARVMKPVGASALGRVETIEVPASCLRASAGVAVIPEIHRRLASEAIISGGRG